MPHSFSSLLGLLKFGTKMFITAEQKTDNMLQGKCHFLLCNVVDFSFFFFSFLSKCFQNFMEETGFFFPDVLINLLFPVFHLPADQTTRDWEKVLQLSKHARCKEKQLTFLSAPLPFCTLEGQMICHILSISWQH